MWPCMIFMVWPMRLGCWACGRVFGGGQRIISVGCLEDHKALEAREGVSTWLDHRWTKWLCSPRKCSVWTGSKGFYIGRVEAKRHIAGLWLQKGLYQP